MQTLLSWLLGTFFSSEIAAPTGSPRCQAPLASEAERAGCGQCGLRVWRDVPVFRMRKRPAITMLFASTAAGIACLWVWIRFPAGLPYVTAAFLLEFAWGLWMMRRCKPCVGVVSPDGLFTVEGKRVVGSVSWAGINGFEFGRWPWQVQVLKSGPTAKDAERALNLWTPTLVRGFIRVAEEVRKTKGGA